MDQLANFVAHSESSPQARTAPTGQTSSTDTHSSHRRLNPAFAAWLMGVPWWWTNPAATNCAQSEMALYRCALQWHLSRLCGEPAKQLIPTNCEQPTGKPYDNRKRH